MSRHDEAKRRLFFMLFFTALAVFLVLIVQPLQLYHFKDLIAVIFPKGFIGIEERNLLLVIQAIMLLVMIPVYLLTFIFSWRYRAYYSKAKYDPDLVDNFAAEVIWWGLPLVLTIIICALTWVKTYELDPYKPLVSDKKAKTIQVVALQWKWLFLYPEEKIATVNFVQFPEKTPIHFEITADAPMNSFWIPHLGGQIYAMPKMKTELYLIADERGDFRGSSANISGEGFADMHFISRASSDEEYEKWLSSFEKEEHILNRKSYEELAKAGVKNYMESYRLEDTDLFHQIVMKGMMPEKQ